MGMTNSTVSQENSAPSTAREPRPFLFIEPTSAIVKDVEFGADDVQLLDSLASPSVPVFVRGLVNFTIALQNRRALENGNVQPIQLSVLNRRRRAARAWFLSIMAGKVDASTCHAVASQWLPTLCGTGPDLGRCIGPSSSIFEFVRGSITACVFAEPADNLVPQVKALHALETVLSAHLTAVSEHGRPFQPIRG